MQPRSLIPTPLLRADEAQVLEELPAGRSRFRALRVALAAVRFLLGSLVIALRRQWRPLPKDDSLGDVAPIPPGQARKRQLETARASEPESYARLLRIEIERLGGFWIKIGQILSLRRDFFSEDFCQELGRLQDRASTFPARDARRILEEELGATVDELFQEFDDRPIAAASIAQIHRARHRDTGCVLAIKIQRPDAEASFRRDLKLVKLIFKVFDRLRILPFFRWKMMTWELERVLEEEIDYRVEKTSVDRMRETLSEHKICAPEVLEDLSGRRVLTMEFMEGVFMSDYIKLKKGDEGRVNRWEEENNVDPTVVAARLYKSLMRQLFEDNLFHGDLHPGNIILLRDSRIALIDFGSVGSLEKGYQRRYQLFVQSLVECEFSRAADVLLLLATSIPVVQISELQQDLVRAMRQWTDRALTKGLPYHRRSVSSNFTDLGNVMFKYRVWMDWAFLRINRTHLTLDSSLESLDPDMHYVDTLKEYFEQAKCRLLGDLLCPSFWTDTVAKWLPVLSETPQYLTEFGLFRAPILRRQLQGLHGSTSKAAFLGQVVFSRLRLLAGIAFPTGAVVYAYQHLGWQPSVWLAQLLGSAPDLAKGEWVALLAVGAVAYGALRSLDRRFKVEDVQVASR